MDSDQGQSHGPQQPTTPISDSQHNDRDLDVQDTPRILDHGKFGQDGAHSDKPRIDLSAASTANLEASSNASVTTSYSNASDRQLGHGSQQDPGDRVFPIRSVISVDPHGRSGRQDYFSERSASSVQRPPHPRMDTETITKRARSATTASGPSVSSPIMSPGPRGQQRRTDTMVRFQSGLPSQSRATIDPTPIFTEDHSDEDDSEPSQDQISKRSPHGSSVGVAPDGETSQDTFMTTRFKHVMTDEGHLVITGRDGRLERCEDEPIHTPGAVQGFGLMLAIREEPDGTFSVRYASENSKRIIGYTPRELFRLANFMDILTEEQADNLLDHIDFIKDEEADPSVNGPEVFSMSVRPPKKRSVKLWCAIHVNPAHPDLIICEFELDDDQDYPLRPVEELTPDVPEDTLDANPTLEELTESTEVLSRPLRVLRSARKRRGEAGAMQVFDILSQVQEQLASAPTLEKLLKILVGIVKELTGFHRVMIYQFDSSFNGKVVTELIDPQQTKDLYHGLHFPASDIPKQARELYKLNKVRLLYDRDQETARLVCRSTDDLETALDMTHSYLRAMSPIHLKYLANMAVRSSMSISINAFNDLWGLIACHSYGPRGMRVSFPIRKMCRLVGDTVSRNIERLSYASRLQARKLINTVPTDKNPAGYIIASSDDLLKLFDADFGMLSIRGETKILGKLPQSQEALAMLEYLRVRKFTSVVTSQDIGTDFPDLRYPPGFTVIAGLLYVPLSVGGDDFIVFFRRGQVKEVKWAGNPYEKFIREGTQNYLEPRKSFKTWHETVLGMSREWSEEQVETAAVLCLVYGKFIEVWRQKEAAIQSSRLTRLLLANSAHEVRTPLNAIINYLEIALEGSLDQETRDNLAKSHSASKSLIYVINDLLDLTNTEEGQELIKDELFDFCACIREATEPFENDARRKGISYEVIEHPGLPKYVYGDQRRVRQAVANVTANAVQHTTEGLVRIELYSTEVQDNRVLVEIVVQDTGRGMNGDQLDALFRDLEQVSSEVDEALPLEKHTEEKPNTRTLGLGLAVVARIVRNMEGQLRLKSDEGKGSRFVIQLPFELQSSGTSDPGTGEATATASITASISTTRPPTHDGEVLLVDRTRVSPGEESERKSLDEVISLTSHRSVTSKGSAGSFRSDADRLIDAIQTPLALGEPDSEHTTKQRSSSRGALYQPVGRPGNLSRRGTSDADIPRSRSAPEPGRDDVAIAPVGLQFVTDSKTPIKPVKIPDEYSDLPENPQPSERSGVLFEIPDKPEGSGAVQPAKSIDAKDFQDTNTTNPSPEAAALQILVAEDDPVNMKILRKRLEKSGHLVFHTLNGEDCATVHKEKSKEFDVVLMDMQMPIVDGLTSTKMIRTTERSDNHAGLSRLALNQGRIPIFAVSASLVEKDKDSYIGAGFDGWILKPIDFKRLETLLLGIQNDETRNSALYAAGQWERGGWFRKRLDLPKADQASHISPIPQEPLRARGTH